MIFDIEYAGMLPITKEDTSYKGMLWCEDQIAEGEKQETCTWICGKGSNEKELLFALLEGKEESDLTAAIKELKKGYDDRDLYQNRIIWLNKIYSDMNDKIWKNDTGKKKLAGITMSLLCFQYNHVICSNIGNTKILLLDKDDILQVSEDHEIQIGEERKILSQYLGINPRQFAITPFIGEKNIVETRQILICSAPVVNVLKEGDISKKLQMSFPITLKAEWLKEELEKKKDPDIAAFLLIQLKERAREYDRR